MSLIIEDGSVVPGAASYISVADADAYHAARGNDTWDAVDNKEAALRKAADYMVQMYRPRWKGYRKSTTQALDWPREMCFLDPSVNGIGADAYSYGYGFGFVTVVPNNIVPTEVKNACAELALRAAATDLAPDISRITKDERIGPIAVTYENYLGPPFVQYRAIDAALAPYLSAHSFTAKLVRA